MVNQFHEHYLDNGDDWRGERSPEEPRWYNTKQPNTEWCPCCRAYTPYNEMSETEIECYCCDVLIDLKTGEAIN